MFDGVPPGLRDLAERQHGILAASQLLEGGVTRDFLKSRVGQGRWQRLHRGVYAAFSGTPVLQATLWAAVLRGGPGAMLSYWTAAESVGLAEAGSHRLIHLTVPYGRRVRPFAGAVLHFSSRASQALHPARLPPQTRVEETVFDLVESMGDIDDACAWPLRAVGKGLTTPDKLRCAMGQRLKMRWRPQMAELLMPDAAGLHSILELRYHRDVELPHRLPAGQRQQQGSLDGHSIYRDRFYAEYLVAVELDGRLAHPDDRRWDDIQRDNAAAADGILTLRYGWLQISTKPCWVAAEAAEALRRRGYLGARACSPPCLVADVVRRYQRSA